MAALATLTNRIKVPYPILLVLGGLGLGFVKFLPQIELDSEVVFLLFLPPLLYVSAIFTSWRDFRANLRPISLLADGGDANGEEYPAQPTCQATPQRVKVDRFFIWLHFRPPRS